MKKDLLTTFNFFNLTKFRKQTKEKLKFVFFRDIKYFLILFLIFFSNTLQAQTTNTFTSSGSFVVAAGLSSVTAECWGAGGAGGGNNNGTSGGGGGGGGYSKATISVTPNTTINYTVGVGPTGTTASGLDGPASIFSTVTANGGKGGTSGGPGIGGLGGAGITTAPATNFSGGNGANGSLVLGAVYSGGGGSSAGTASNGNPGIGLGGGGAAVAGGGAGGAGVLLAGNGANGAVPGGGGGGGLVLLAGNFNGGNGANGQIKITYTCPTYNITATTASNTCVTDGYSSVQVTSTTTLLPQGNYTVTYNRSSPSATGLTVAMTVNASGVGTFTVGGFSTAGASSISITRIASGTCSSTLTLPNTAYTANLTVFPASIGGSVTGNATICSGSTSGTLTLSGQTGTVLKWQSSVSPFSTWTDIASTAGITTYTSGALTQTTQFKAVVQSGTCTAIESNPVTITVNPLPQGSLTANGPFCATGTGQLTFTATSGTGPYTVVYTENGGVNRTATGVVSGTAFTPFTTPVTASATYALVSVTDANCTRSSGFTGGSAVITVNPLPQGSLTSVSPLCGSGTGQLTFTATAGTGPYTVVYTENGGTNRTATGVVSGTAFAPFTTP
ncbi:glycine-rich domain-containing protein, partial [Flavobacterium quisquiliarum]